MRSTSRGQLHSAIAFARPRSPSSRRRSGAATSSPIPAATAAGSPRGTSRPGRALVDDRPHARVVGRDHRQPARHRLDQDDPERLRGLGGEQEQVGGAQDLGQLGVGDRPEEVDALADPGRRGAVAKAVEQLAAAGDHQVDVVADPGERVDRDVQPLEVMGAVEGGDECRDDRVGRDPEPLAQCAAVAGLEALGVDAVRHLDQLLPARARRCGAGSRPSRRDRPRARRRGRRRGSGSARPCARRRRTAAPRGPLPTSRFL